MDKGAKKLKQLDSVFESLRIERTNYNQKQFAEVCKIPLKTYQRWISGKTEGRPNLLQLKALCKELKINSIEELPDDFAETFSNTSNKNT